MTRRDAIRAAVDAALMAHPGLDTSDSLRGVCLDVKLKAGTISVRAVLVKPEYEELTIETDARGFAQTVRVVSGRR